MIDQDVDPRAHNLKTQLPIRWQQCQLRRVVQFENGSDYKDVEVSEGGYPVFGSGGEFKRSSEYLYDGESVLFGRKGTVDRPVHVNGRFWTVDTMFFTRLSAEVNGRFLYYAATTIPFSLYSTNTALPSVTSSDLGAHVLAIPPREVQDEIAIYLDRETARIDTLVEKQEKLIETLRERRASEIEQAVLQGLTNENLEANSLEWLPHTPRHWKVVQLGFVAETLAGYAFASEGFSKDPENTALLRGINLKPGRTDWTETVYWDEEKEPVPAAFHLRTGDIVVGMDRPFVSGGARVALIQESDLPALLLQRVMRVRMISAESQSCLQYLMQTKAFVSYLQPLFTGVSVPHMSEWQVRKFRFPYPPPNEQRQIVEYLNEQTTKIDTLIEKAQQFIALANERRSALITAAVTGQIDVREV